MAQMVRHTSDFSYRGLAYAIVLHGAVFLGAGSLLDRPAEFGTELGRSSLEIDWVAAPEEIHPNGPPPIALEQPNLEAWVTTAPNPEEFPIPQLVKEDPQTVSLQRPKPILLTQDSVAKGDGSSPTPGKEETTLHSKEGALSNAQPDYLRNPPPRYPFQARKLRQEGLVLLQVRVSEQGTAQSVTLKQSSGFHLLDESALRAVQTWTFSPARVGPFAISTEVDVPIRFELD